MVEVELIWKLAIYPLPEVRSVTSHDNAEMKCISINLSMHIFFDSKFKGVILTLHFTTCTLILTI